MSTAALDAIVDAEAEGIKLRLVDGKVKAFYSANAQVRVAPLLERLRANRTEVSELLRQRSETPPMPPGIRLVHWQLKKPPVMLMRCSVVNDPAQFARYTLDQLQAALEGKNWLAGHWTIQELCERLEQVGVKVEVTVRGLPTSRSNQ